MSGFNIYVIVYLSVLVLTIVVICVNVVREDRREKAEFMKKVDEERAAREGF